MDIAPPPVMLKAYVRYESGVCSCPFSKLESTVRKLIENKSQSEPTFPVVAGGALGACEQVVLAVRQK